MKFSVQIGDQLDKLNRELPEYTRLAMILPEDALRKQGGEFSFRLFNALKQIAPPQGLIGTSARARFKAGGGILLHAAALKSIARKYQIDPGGSRFRKTKLVRSGRGRGAKILGRESSGGFAGSILEKGKRLNLQALVARTELGFRERGRRFLALSASFPRDLNNRFVTKTERGAELSERVLSLQSFAGELAFKWGGLSHDSDSAAQGLSKPRAQAAIAEALQSTRDNMLEYIRRKTKFPVAA